MDTIDISSCALASVSSTGFGHRWLGIFFQIPAFLSSTKYHFVAIMIVLLNTREFSGFELKIILKLLLALKGVTSSDNKRNVFKFLSPLPGGGVA